VRALDSLSAKRYDSTTAVISFIPRGRFAIPPDDTVHLAPYHVPAKWLVLDGRDKIDFTAMPAEDYGTDFASGIDQARSESSYVTLAVAAAAVDTDEAEGIIVVKVTVDTTMPGSDLRLLAVVTEDSMATHARYPVVFDRVARRFVPDAAGKSFSVARFDTLYDTMRFSTVNMRPSQLGAAIFVEDASDHTIVQATQLWRFSLKED
jgi:hypothetical protein